MAILSFHGQRYTQYLLQLFPNLAIHSSFLCGWSFGAAVLSKTHHIEYGGEVSEVVIAVRSGDAYLTVDPVDGGVKLIKKNAVDAVSLHKK